MGSLSLLQGIFPTQGPNPGLLHCRQILYQLSHKGSPVSYLGGQNSTHDGFSLLSAPAATPHHPHHALYTDFIHVVMLYLFIVCLPP